jgi:hypothetical protein
VELQLIVVSLCCYSARPNSFGLLAYLFTHPSSFVLYRNENVCMSSVFTKNNICLIGLLINVMILHLSGI